MSRQNLINLLREAKMKGLGDLRMVGDVPTDYNGPTPPYSGTILAPYDPSGPLGGFGRLGAMLRGKALARAQFLTWLKEFNPAIFEGAVQQAEDWKSGLASPTALSGVSLAGLGDGETTSAPSSWWDQFTTAATSLGTAYLAYKGQQNVLRTNIQRAQYGLPPIDPTTGAPVVRTSVSLSPQLMARLSDTGSVLLYVGLGVGALLVLSKVFGGRGRR